jgi:hypothetical protein
VGGREELSAWYTSRSALRPPDPFLWMAGPDPALALHKHGPALPPRLEHQPPQPATLEHRHRRPVAPPHAPRRAAAAAAVVITAAAERRGVEDLDALQPRPLLPQRCGQPARASPAALGRAPRRTRGGRFAGWAAGLQRCSARRVRGRGIVGAAGGKKGGERGEGAGGDAWERRAAEAEEGPDYVGVGKQWLCLPAVWGPLGMGGCYLSEVVLDIISDFQVLYS